MTRLLDIRRYYAPAETRTWTELIAQWLEVKRGEVRD